jgi:hypothetical protein
MLKVIKETDPRLNRGKAKNIRVYRHEKAGISGNKNTRMKSFENVSEVQAFRNENIHKDIVHKEFKRRLNSGNIFLQRILEFHVLLSALQKIEV